MEILKLNHEIQLLKLQLKQRDEIIALMSASPVPIELPIELNYPQASTGLKPLNPIDLTVPSPEPSPKLSINENTTEIFKKCLFIDCNSSTNEEWFQKGYFNEDLSTFQMEINDFIQCHIEKRDWKHKEQFDLYKKEVLGKKTYQQVKDNAKVKGLKILNEKGYMDESMDKISNIMSKLSNKVYDSILPAVLIPEFYTEEALCTYLQESMNRESKCTEHLTTLDLISALRP